jgi:hypothetical protein
VRLRNPPDHSFLTGDNRLDGRARSGQPPPVKGAAKQDRPRQQDPEQTEETTALRNPCLAANQDDNSPVRPLFGQRQKVIAIAGYEQRALIGSEIQNTVVRRIHWKEFSEPLSRGPGLFDSASKGLGDIVVEREPHVPASAICRATR